MDMDQWLEIRRRVLREGVSRRQILLDPGQQQIRFALRVAWSRAPRGPGGSAKRREVYLRIRL